MEHRCRMLLRGIDASPVRPDYCPYMNRALPIIDVKGEGNKKGSGNNIFQVIKESFPVWIIVLEVVLFAVAFAGMIGGYFWKMRHITRHYSRISVQ
jgi:hypothetical protein